MANIIRTALVAASVLLGGFASTAAFAAAAPCSEQPNVDSCPTFGSPSKAEQTQAPRLERHAHSYRMRETTQKG